MIKIFSFVVLLTVGTSGFDPESHKNWKLLPHDICGQVDSSRIIGGVEAPMNSYPWLALIGYRSIKSNKSNKILFECGGTVANSKTILTAAHCVTHLGGLKVEVIRLGEHNTETNPDCNNEGCADPVLDIPPSEIIIPKKYNDPLFKHDLALIRLKNDIKFSAFIKPICFGGKEFQKKNFVGTTAEVAGWGIYNIDKNEASTTLQVVKLRVVRNEECKKHIPSYIDIGPTQLCVGGKPGRDSCNGDSGGPLMKVDNSFNGPRYHLLGIVSFGAKKCGKTKMPGVYTKMSEHMEWFLENLKTTTSSATEVK